MQEPFFFYLVVSGNSGVGKSTLLKSLQRRLSSRFSCLDVVDEREFHHPFLLNMFRDPELWAYPTQLNFIIQRSLRILNAFENGGRPLALVMERCLLEDALFLRYYSRLGHIDEISEQAYGIVFERLVSAVPRPQVIVHLRGEVEVLCRRLELAYERGERPLELKGESLRDYIAGMNTLYDEWASSFPSSGVEYIECSIAEGNYSADQVANHVEREISRRFFV